MLEQRPMGHSRTIQSKLVLPADTNHLETIFGGHVLAHIDEIGAIAAMKHCNEITVTASIDSVDFLSPSKLGDVLELEAIVTSTGRSSMDVFVKVYSMDLLKNEKRLTTQSFLTMVAMDKDGHTIPVPGVYPETEEEMKLFDIGLQRRKDRKKK